MKDSMPHIDCCLAFERPASCQHFIEQYAGGKDISASVDSISASLLGRGVGCSAIGNANFRQLGVMNSGSPSCFFIEKFCQSEVQNFNLTGGRHSYIARLDVSMNYAACVGRSKCIGCLQRYR